MAGFALLLVVGGLLPGGSDINSDVMPEVAISISAPQTVNLAFDVAHAMDDATLSIDLPGNVEVVGFPGMKHLSWQTSLTQGLNILPLPLKGVASANGELVAKLKPRYRQDKPAQKQDVRDEADDGRRAHNGYDFADPFRPLRKDEAYNPGKDRQQNGDEQNTIHMQSPQHLCDDHIGHICEGCGDKTKGERGRSKDQHNRKHDRCSFTDLRPCIFAHEDGGEHPYHVE